MSDISATVVWFSLALDYGLSFLSLGKPGTQGADAQLITGGLTAVESLLGTEIGAQQDGFVVDHGTSLMERFPIKPKNEGSSIFAQFLLQTTTPGEQVDRNQVPIARKFVSDLAKSIFDSKLWEDLQISAQLISPLQLYDFIIPVYEKVNQEFKLKPIGNLAEESVNKILNDSFTSFDYSEILNKLSSVLVENIDSYLKENRSNLLQKFSKEVISKFIQDFPLIFLYTPPKFVKQEVHRFITSYLENQTIKKTENIVYDLVKDFFDNSMHDIMQEFDIERIKDDRAKIREAVVTELKKSIIKQYPLLILANPSLEIKNTSFDELVDKRVLDKVFIEYDLGEILSKVAEQLVLEANSEDFLQADLIKGFFKNLSLRFPGGLPDQLWNILIQLLKIYAAEAKVNLTSINTRLDIPDVHWTTLKLRFDQFKPNPVAQFRGGGELIHFFEGVREAIARSFDQFYNSFVWNITEENFGQYFKLFNEECRRIFQSFLTTRHIVALLNILASSSKYNLLNPLNTYINYDKFLKFLNEIQYKGSRSTRLFTGFSEFDDNNLVKFLHYSAEKSVKKEFKQIESALKSVETHQNYLESVIKKIDDTELSKFSKIRFKDSISKELSSEFIHFNQKEIDKIKKEIERINKNVFDDFSKEFNGFKSEIEVSSDKQFSKLAKKKEKLLQNLKKILEKTKFSDFSSNINKMYQEIISSLESEFEDAQKELSKIMAKDGIKQLKLEINNGKVIKSDKNLDVIKNMYLKEENKKYKGDVFIKDTDFLYAFSSAYLFDIIDANISKKAINLAIFDSKSSKLILEVIERGKAERKSSSKLTDILGHLKDELIETGGEIFDLSNMIVNHIKKSIVSEDFPLKIFYDQYEILSLPIDTLDKDFKVYIDKNLKIHPKLHLELNEKSKKVDVSFEITRRPSVGSEIEYLMDAIAINVYNNELLRMGSYIESLKLVSNSLGENESRKIQELFNMLGTRLTT